MKNITEGYNTPATLENITSVGTISWTTTSSGGTAQLDRAQGTKLLRATGFAFGDVHDDAIIQGIEVSMVKHDQDASNDIRDSFVQLVLNGSTTGSNKAIMIQTWPSTATTFVYGSPTDNWGSTLTGAGIKDLDFETK